VVDVDVDVVVVVVVVVAAAVNITKRSSMTAIPSLTAALDCIV